VEGASEYFEETYWIKRNGEMLFSGNQVEKVEAALIDKKE
jgi:hypothetical protein